MAESIKFMKALRLWEGLHGLQPQLGRTLAVSCWPSPDPSCGARLSQWGRQMQSGGTFMSQSQGRVMGTSRGPRLSWPLFSYCCLRCSLWPDSNLHKSVRGDTHTCAHTHAPRWDLLWTWMLLVLLWLLLVIPSGLPGPFHNLAERGSEWGSLHPYHESEGKIRMKFLAFGHLKTELCCSFLRMSGCRTSHRGAWTSEWLEGRNGGWWKTKNRN